MSLSYLGWAATKIAQTHLPASGPADSVIANADDDLGSDFTRRVWVNACLAVYAR